MASVLVVDMHVYLQQKITQLLEEEGHFVIGIYPGRDLLGVNLRNRQFDYILVNTGVSPRFRDHLQSTINRYQDNCTVLTAVYDRDDLLETIT